MNKKILIPILLSSLTLLLTSCFFTFPFKPDNVSSLESIYMKKNYKDYHDNNLYSIDCSPSVGTVKHLIIPVWFNDSNKYIPSKSSVKEDIVTTFSGSKKDTGWNSVKSFYETESNGRLTLYYTISDWYEDNHQSSYYNSSERTVNLVNQVTDWYFQNYDDQKISYDSDKNGYIDSVILIYGAPNYQNSVGSNNSNLWAYTFWVQDVNKQNVNNPGVNSFMFASYDFMYNDTRYCELDAHTYIHETGHLFGLTDYYDYSGKYLPAGGFSMQDYNVGGHDPFSCLALGWAKAIIPQDSGTFKLEPFQDSHEVVILSPHWNSYDSPFDEYLILEYYTPSGLNQFDSAHSYDEYYPTGPFGKGLRVWHVDARLLYFIEETINVNNVTTNPSTFGFVTSFMSNSYYDEGEPDLIDYISIAGEDYQDYNILQWIRNDERETHHNEDFPYYEGLFTSLDSFSLSKFSRQFVNGTKLNNGQSLGWSVDVDSISGDELYITLNRY